MGPLSMPSGFDAAHWPPAPFAGPANFECGLGSPCSRCHAPCAVGSAAGSAAGEEAKLHALMKEELSPVASCLTEEKMGMRRAMLEVT